MDQQYDKTILDDKLGEKYVFTVEEAEEWSRRSFRWTRNKN
jgi:hypothetical protein